MLLDRLYYTDATLPSSGSIIIGSALGKWNGTSLYSSTIDQPPPPPDTDDLIRRPKHYTNMTRLLDLPDLPVLTDSPDLSNLADFPDFMDLPDFFDAPISLPSASS